MTRGLAVPAATAGILAALVSAIVALGVDGADETAYGTHEVGTITPAAGPGPAAFTSIVLGARNAVDCTRADVRVEEPALP
ncbi:hypothetical protein ACFZBU_25670 [Embleya sp. NPDC008237]|uniref:hypothetical protein n=1 Tax=Embleya sp. NPDC008237 TaxID=3363978 RepID=UPI0036F07875